MDRWPSSLIGPAVKGRSWFHQPYESPSIKANTTSDNPVTESTIPTGSRLSPESTLLSGT